MFNVEVIIKSQQRFRSDHHKGHSEEVNKIALSSNDDKRIQAADKITTYPYGVKLDDNETDQIIISSQKLREESEKCRKESSEIIIRSQKLREEPKSLREISKSLREKSRNETDWIIENQKSNLMILLCFQNCSDLEMKHNNTEMKHCNTKMKCL